jgi:phosphatidylglycerol:prolipoprotein diacylglycerol transferase
MFYSVGRFLIEFLRGDVERGHIGILSTSQFISVFMMLAGVILIMKLRSTHNGNTSNMVE